jgi:hypothetical protein
MKNNEKHLEHNEKIININMDVKKTWIWSFRGFSTN